MMRTPMESVMKEFDSFMNGKTRPGSKEELDVALQEFIQGYNGSFASREPVTEKTAKSSEDFMELAEKAKSRKKRLEYLQKAYELDERNFDAVIGIAVELPTDSLEMDTYLSRTVKDARRLMEEDGYFEEANIGKFWLITETRPYMRLLELNFEVYVRQSRYRRALDIGNEMLKLCSGDNIGIRYQMMAVYAMLQKKEAAEDLFKKYDEEDSTMFLFPMAYMYYLLGEEDKAEEILRKLLMVNKDTKKFLTSKGSIPKNYHTSPYGVMMGTLDEYVECLQYAPGDLYESGIFWEWAKGVVKGMKKDGVRI